MHNTRLLVLEACVQPDAVALLGWAEKEPVEMCFVRGETALRVTKPPFPGLCVPPSHPSRHTDPTLGIMLAALPGKPLCQPFAVKFFSRALCWTLGNFYSQSGEARAAPGGEGLAVRGGAQERCGCGTRMDQWAWWWWLD